MPWHLDALLWTSVALAEWETAAMLLIQGHWCNQTISHSAQCTVLSEALRAGCDQGTYEGTLEKLFWANQGGFAPSYTKDTGLAQRMIPFIDVPGDRAVRAWQKAGDSGYTPAELVTECLTEEFASADWLTEAFAWFAGDQQWWARPGEQPGANALGEFVTKHFG